MSVRPMQTRGKEPRRMVSWFSESSIASSGDEYRPQSVIKRVKRVGHASQIIKRALKSCGLAKQETILDKARARRRDDFPDPIVSYDAEETEFVEVDEAENSGSSQSGYGDYGDPFDLCGGSDSSLTGRSN